MNRPSNENENETGIDCACCGERDIPFECQWPAMDLATRKHTYVCIECANEDNISEDFHVPISINPTIYVSLKDNHTIAEAGE